MVGVNQPKALKCASGNEPKVLLVSNLQQNGDAASFPERMLSLNVQKMAPTRTARLYSG
jgi:hypothetical protein